MMNSRDYLARNTEFGGPAGVHNNHYASLSQLVKNSLLLNHMVYFDQILRAYACQHCLTTGMRTCDSLFHRRYIAWKLSGRSWS